MEKNEISPAQVGVAHLDNIASLAGTPRPDEGCAHIWRRVQTKLAAVDDPGVPPAWGIEDSEDLHLEPRQSLHENLVECIIYDWDPSSSIFHEKENNGRLRFGKVRVYSHQ